MDGKNMRSVSVHLPNTYFSLLKQKKKRIFNVRIFKDVCFTQKLCKATQLGILTKLVMVPLSFTSAIRHA